MGGKSLFHLITPSLRQVMAGTLGKLWNLEQEQKQKLWSNGAYWHSLHCFLSMLLYTAQTHIPKCSTIHSRLAHKHQPLIKTPLAFITSHSILRHFFNWSSFFNDDHRLCQVNKTLTSYSVYVLGNMDHHSESFLAFLASLTLPESASSDG